MTCLPETCCAPEQIARNTKGNESSSTNCSAHSFREGSGEIFAKTGSDFRILLTSEWCFVSQEWGQVSCILICILHVCFSIRSLLLEPKKPANHKWGKHKGGARVVLGGPIRAKVWLQLEVLIHFPRLIQSGRMFTQVTVYFKKCFMETGSGCWRDEASRGLTYKRLNPKGYTQGGLHHQTHAHYGLDRRRHHLHYPRYDHPHPSPSSHCITSHHSMVSFFHKVSHCVGFTLARLPIGTFPIGNIANVFQVFRA